MPKQAQAKSSTQTPDEVLTEFLADLPAEVAAHCKLLDKLAALTPPPIKGKATADAVRARVEHLRAIQQAVGEYVEAVNQDTTDHLPGRVDCAKADVILFDALCDADDPDYDLIATLARAGCRFAPAAPARAAA